MIAMLHSACSKLKSCPSTSGGSLAMVCSQGASLPRPSMPSNCPAAQKCLESIDSMDCNAGASGSDPLSSIMLFKDCARAATEC